MNTRETLILKTLQLKSVTHGLNVPGLIDQMLEQDPEKADQLTKNVCARIPLELAKDMENISAALHLNKREIITLAVIDFLAQAKATINEFGALPEGEQI